MAFEEISSEESDWDEAGGSRRCVANPQALEAGEVRPYCFCGKLLKHVANIPRHSWMLACTASYDCGRCEDTILAGDMHFQCSTCKDVRICKDCGPGVYIAKSFDFFDQATGESQVREIPSKVLHMRKKRQAKHLKSRGVLLSDGDPSILARGIAEAVVQAGKRMCREVLQEEEDVQDADWGDEAMLSRLLGAKSDTEVADRLKLLVEAATHVFASQQTLTDVTAPCKVFGDLHGQFRDLLLLCGTFGFPGTPEAPSAVFNGDFVDRGRHQLEVVTLLFALKVLYPDNVFLNRGNHEDDSMNVKYGFQKACFMALGQYGREIYAMISKAFTYLPLASLIEEKVFVAHGGIGDGNWSLAQLRRVQRPLQHSDLQADKNSFVWNLLWSDPIEDDEANAKVFGVHSSPRGKLAVKFGWNVTQAFCARNGIDLVIRSHQSKKGGLGFDVMHNESLIRVFSARDYEGHHNDGAVLSVTHPDEEDGLHTGVLNVRPQVISSLSNSR